MELAEQDLLPNQYQQDDQARDQDDDQILVQRDNDDLEPPFPREVFQPPLRRNMGLTPPMAFHTRQRTGTTTGPNTNTRVNNNNPMTNNRINNSNTTHHSGINSNNRPKSSHLYILFSTILALLAIISPSSKRHTLHTTNTTTNTHSHANENRVSRHQHMSSISSIHQHLYTLDTASSSSTTTSSQHYQPPNKQKSFHQQIAHLENTSTDNLSPDSDTTSTSTIKLPPPLSTTSSDTTLLSIPKQMKEYGTIITNSHKVNHNTNPDNDNNNSHTYNQNNNNNNNPIMNILSSIWNHPHRQEEEEGSISNHQIHENKLQSHNPFFSFWKSFFGRNYNHQHKMNVDTSSSIKNKKHNTQSSKTNNRDIHKQQQQQQQQRNNINRPIYQRFVRIALQKLIDPNILEFFNVSFYVPYLQQNPSQSQSKPLLTVVEDSTQNHEKNDKIKKSSSSSSSSSSSNQKSTLDTATIATRIIDKILTSTPRLLAITNLLLAVTYLLQSGVADFFLGDDSSPSTTTRTTTATTTTTTNPTTTGTATNTPNTTTGNPIAANTRTNHNDAAMNNMLNGGIGLSTSNRMHRSGRERLGGYLLFKLLLISAVVEPDTLDLLILLSWYTLLAFFKSLSHLGGIAISHASASGQPPRRGVFKLLLTIFVCNASAATLCAALFHGAGWGMVLLLTCDCALLGLDILVHLARFTQQYLEEWHQKKLGDIEERQMRLHGERRGENGRNRLDDGEDLSHEGFHGCDDSVNGDGEISDEGIEDEDDDQEDNVQNQSQLLDHEIEMLEGIHSRRLGIIDYVAFVLEILSLVITVGHFLHIWSLHGVHFNLVDGVLALHLHSAISATGKKIEERRNHNRIARDLDKLFEDATDIELRKACAGGDVCCICLGTMSMGQIKKIGCGHFYHTNCLREVVERARSIEAARCPLCRASIVDGRQVDSNSPRQTATRTDGNGGTNRTNGGGDIDENNTGTQNGQLNNNIVNDGDVLAGLGVQNNANERALFRFSTEGILPAWLPIPAFSFEVVRRPPIGMETIADDNVVAGQDQGQINNDNNNVDGNENIQEQPEQSFWRRILVLSGAIPMSPEEEAAAVDLLVDMFPQYDRSELLREVRQRGSSEAVAEAILSGVFSGPLRNTTDGMVDVDDIFNTTENESDADGNTATELGEIARGRE